MKVPKRVKLPAVIAAGVILAGGGTAYAVVAGEDAPTYRTVTATTGDVEQTLTLTGLVDAARRSDLSFGTDGTVDRVRVEQGDAVKAGQVIATLDAEDLDAAVTQARAALASAKAQLESDQDAQTTSVEQAVSPTKPSGPSAGSGSSNGNSSANANAALLKKLKAQQQAVLEAQSAASAAIAAADAALTAQAAACADAYQAAPASSGDAAADAAAVAAADEANAACDAALADVQEKQAAVKDAQSVLQDALTELGKTLTSALGAASNQPTGATSARAAASSAASADVPNGSTGSDGTSNGSAGGTVTAARLASDQAQIDQAEADLVSARAARAQAVLRSTRSGTVVSLDLAKGDAVSTGTAVAVVVGGKAVTLTGAVVESSVATVKVGQVARITVAGSSTTTTGTVTAIGLTADSSSGSTSYPVTVTVEDPTIALPTGSRAQVAIVLSTAEDVVTLPISAVTRNGENAVVRTWDGSALRRTTVTLGAVGTRTVAITDGIGAGDEVVIADVDQAIDGASSELNERGGFGPPGGVTFRQGGPAGGGGGPRLGVAAN